MHLQPVNALIWDSSTDHSAAKETTLASGTAALVIATFCVQGNKNHVLKAFDF